MINLFNWLLELNFCKLFKLFSIFCCFCLCIYVLVKFIGIGKISKEGFECNSTNQQFSGYKGWAFGIEPYFRDLLELTLADIGETTKRSPEMFEKLKQYHKAECLTYNALLKRYRLHHFFPFISADSLSKRDIKKIEKEVMGK
ncbi:MAG: hypothetical protein J6X78_02750 [Treponema sp.]|nr:hypothetical protein [Treponema sp.]